MSTADRDEPRVGPLNGIRVIECGEGVSAAYAARLLAELGADVVKVERPEGDVTRRSGPFAGDPDPEASGLFHVLNFEKRGIVLDLDEDEGRRTLDELLAGADVLIDNDPIVQRRLRGLDGPAVLARHPHLVAVSVTPYGDEGVLAGVPGTALTSSAFGGMTWLIGEADAPPLPLPYDLADYFAGASAAGAALAAVFARLRLGAGQVVDVAVCDVLASFLHVFGTIIYDFGGPWRREGRRASGSAGCYPCSIFPCKDGYIAIIGRGPSDWENILKAMGSPSWADEERFQDPFRIAKESADETDAHLIAWMSEYTQDELRTMADEHNLALASIRTIADTLEEPQNVVRGVFAEPLDVGGRPVTPPLGPAVLSGSGRVRTIRRAPRLGEHTQEVLAALSTGPHREESR